MLVRAGFVVVLVLVNVSGFRPVLARGGHGGGPLPDCPATKASSRSRLVTARSPGRVPLRSIKYGPGGPRPGPTRMDPADSRSFGQESRKVDTLVGDDSGYDDPCGSTAA